jgi:membrane protein DedA with SNARE-associated domain
MHIAAFTDFVVSHQFFAYTLLFLGMIFEGEIVLIFTGILLYIGALGFWPAYFFALAGLISKTFLAYSLGGLLSRKYPSSKILNYIKRKVLFIFPDFARKPFWHIFVSKFLSGFNNFTLIFSGFLNLNFRMYLRAELISNIIWMPLIITLGYFFGYAALAVTKEIKKFLLLIGIFIVGFIILEKAVTFVYEFMEGLYHTLRGDEKEESKEN